MGKVRKREGIKLLNLTHKQQYGAIHRKQVSDGLGGQDTK